MDNNLDIRTKELRQKLEEIAQCVIREINNLPTSLNKNLGLYDGEFGVLLFLAYYSEYKNDIHSRDVFNLYLERLLNEFSNSINSHTFCSGVAGIFSVMKYLDKNHIVHIDIHEAENMLESYLVKCMDKDMDRRYFDFMHGVLGVGFYFIARNKQQYLDNIINFLFDIAEKDSSLMRWKSFVTDNSAVYNISLSHGISSIIIFLCMARRYTPNHKVLMMLKGAVNYVLSQEINFKEYGSFFPPFSIEVAIQKSRLGWCYGDLGIATALWRASEILEDPNLKNKAFEIFKFSTSRLNLKENKIIDTSICHGTSGLSMIFRRMYINTGENIFNRTSNYWLDQTLNHSVYKDGLAGFKTYNPINNWHNNFSLLNGIAGVGLILVSYLRNDNQDWDQLFLLS